MSSSDLPSVSSSDKDTCHIGLLYTLINSFQFGCLSKSPVSSHSLGYCRGGGGVGLQQLLAYESNPRHKNKQCSPGYRQQSQNLNPGSRS